MTDNPPPLDYETPSGQAQRPRRPNRDPSWLTVSIIGGFAGSIVFGKFSLARHAPLTAEIVIPFLFALVIAMIFFSAIRPFGATFLCSLLIIASINVVSCGGLFG